MKPYHGYQKNNKKRIYQIDNNTIEDQPKGFHTTFEIEEKYMTYLNKSFDEIIISFIKINIACPKCRLFFPLKSKL